MSSRFDMVPDANISRTKFNEKCGLKTTIKADYLYPIFTDEIYPSDTMYFRPNIFVRMISPLLYPMIDNMYLDTFSFFVPWRLVFEDFVHLMGEKISPDDDTEYMIPTYTDEETFTSYSLEDYLGLPVGKTPTGLDISCLYARAYALIWNEYFRDNDLQDPIEINIDDTNEDAGTYGLQKRNKKRDYFTSCRPWPQAGDEVIMPMGTTAPVVGNGMALSFYEGSNMFIMSEGSGHFGSSNNYPSVVGAAAAKDDSAADGYAIGLAGVGQLGTDLNYSGLEALLSQATGPDVNSVREALLMQQLLEQIARGGTRYVEQIYHQFKVRCPDYRLQRPEYLGGSSQRINVHPVPQTSEAGTTEQGNLAGYAATFGDDGGWIQSFTEHGCVMTLANIRADLTYQQGVDRKFNTLTRFDFYTPMLQGLGEQAVLNSEIYYQGSGAPDDVAVFGYQRNFEHLCYEKSMITGMLRSNATGGTIHEWHLSENFTSLPVLDTGFLPSNTPILRVAAMTEQDAFILDCQFDYECERAMKPYSIPGMGLRF